MTAWRVVHTIGRQTPPVPINVVDAREHLSRAPTCRRCPSCRPVLEKQDYWLADFENLRLHYALTLAEWNRRFQLNRERSPRHRSRPPR